MKASSSTPPQDSSVVDQGRLWRRRYPLGRSPISAPACSRSTFPGQLRCGGRGEALRDRHMVQCLGKVGQGRGDNLFCLPGSERTPAFCLVDEVNGADTSVVKAAVDGEREVAVDPSVLKGSRRASTGSGRRSPDRVGGGTARPSGYGGPGPGPCCARNRYQNPACIGLMPGAQCFHGGKYRSPAKAI
jgi:hypothetical protein